MFDFVARILMAMVITARFSGRPHIISSDETSLLKQHEDGKMTMFGRVLKPYRFISSQSVEDCVYLISKAGDYVVAVNSTSEVVCGIYVYTDPDQVVEISFPHLNLSCGGEDLISVFDGWELNGEYFPPEDDHHLPLKNRFAAFCDKKNRTVFVSSQNVGLVHYMIPTVGSSFTISVKFEKNDQPCNVFVSSENASITLRNYGKRINCTVMALYPAAVQITALDIGGTREHGAAVSTMECSTPDQCAGSVAEDELQIGGANGLNTSQSTTLVGISNVHSISSVIHKIIDCGVTVMKLVSSGNYNNSLNILVYPVMGEELNNADLNCYDNVTSR